MAERSWSDSILILGGTAMLSAAAVGSVQFWVQGGQHVTGEISGSGSVTITDHIKVTGSPFCEYMDGIAVKCHAKLTSTSTGSISDYATLKLQNTNANVGFTGTGAITGIVVYGKKPGEQLTAFTCGTTTGSNINLSSRQNLLDSQALDSGATIFGRAFATKSGSLVWRKSEHIKCFTTATVENGAGLSLDGWIEYRQVQ